MFASVSSLFPLIRVSGSDILNKQFIEDNFSGFCDVI